MTEHTETPPGQSFVAKPVGSLELICLGAAVLICDLTIYRGEGFFGLAVLYLLLPVLLFISTAKRRCNFSLGVTSLLLGGVVVRLAWCGSPGAVVAGGACLVAFAMALAGMVPYVTRILTFASQAVAFGHRAIVRYFARLLRFYRLLPSRARLLSVGFPLVALFVFGTLFTLANPDLMKLIGNQFDQLIREIESWLTNISFMEIPFCIGAGWLFLGLLHPELREPDEWVVMEQEEEGDPSLMYDAFRNTLLMVVGLFAIYLVFEFKTLWFRVFPQGFHYSGYAHQGAAWLTVALGLATVMLSVIFQGRILRDPRVGGLRRLAWIWSAENFILAIAVFHRLSIYVGFNGMTRMRTVGWLGIGSVVIGFLLVVIKIHRGKDFRWLLRRELWTVSLAAYLYVVMPVDRWVTRYNVRRILAGDPAPSVQISEHPLSAEGYLELAPLRDCEDSLIRRGIIAMLAMRHEIEQTEQGERNLRGWTRRQWASEQLLKQLEGIKASDAVSPKQRELDRAAFAKYAYQWY